MQISCEKFELLLKAEFALSVYKSEEHKLQAQAMLEKQWGKDLGRFATMQRKILPKAYKKLPTWHAAKCFFTPKSFEQSTPEAVARFKASLFKGEKLLSLTGGLGVDDWAMCDTFKNVCSIDPDSDLNCLTRINFKKLGITNYTRINDQAETFLKTTKEEFDCYYIDPDRRAADENKGLNPTLFSPNIIELINTHSYVKNQLWLKLSPATDITWIRENVHAQIDIYIIEWQGEVKEILCNWHPLMSAKLKVCILPFMNFELNTAISNTPCNDEILFEPSPALIKSQFMHGEFGNTLGLERLNDDYTLFKSIRILPKSMGIQGKIISQGTEGFKQIKKEMIYCKVHKASVTCKSYPLKPAEVMKKLKLKESSDHQLYLTSQKGKKYWFLIEKLKNL